MDLENNSIIIAAEILEMTKKARKGDGKSMALEILRSKRALQQFRRILEAQGTPKNNIESRLAPAKLSYVVESEKSGKISGINNRGIAEVALSAGCPADKGAGLFLHVHNGFKVKKGDPLITLYAETPEKLKFAKKAYASLKPISMM
jgi:AMP phosphorylase